MDKFNYFSGISLAYSVVTQYYPVNYANPYFDHFVFQPMLGDGHKADDDFTLAAYAVDADGTVLNNQGMLDTNPLPGHKVQVTKKCIQFANLHLDLTALGQLYKPGSPPSELRIYPSGVYYSNPNGKETDYMLYTAETGDEVDPDVVVKTPINPSPPY